MRLRILSRITLAIYASLSPLLASDSSSLPYLKATGDKNESSGEVFPLESIHAEVTIAGPLAKVTLTQTFSNGGNEPLDAVYLFPASTGAAVHEMSMTIGDRTIVAEIQKKEEARKTFEKAKQESKSASLLEQERPNLFQMSVARILPGDEIKVSLSYSELLKPEENIYQFVFPTTYGPRYGTPSQPASPVANPFLGEGEQSPTDFSLSLDLNAGLPLQSVKCTTHPLEINFLSKQQATISWQSRLGDQGNDRDLIIDYQLADEAITSGLLLHEGEDENFLQLAVQPPAKVTPQHIPPRDFLFVIDVSGSMNGFPLNTSKALFRSLCSDLRPIDSFNMLLFAGDSRVLSPKPLVATKYNVENAINFLDQESGRGGTELVHALQKALAMPQPSEGSRSVVVISDGFVNFESDAFELVRQNLNRANLFAFGIGSSVNRHLIEGLAAVGEGEPFIVTKSSEAREVSARFQDYISAPVLTNIQVTTTDCAVSDFEPAHIRDLFAKRPLSLVAKWEGEARGEITISGLTGRGETWSQSLSLAEAATRSGTHHPSLRPLWARERVRHLSDYAKLSGKPDTIAAVSDLGLRYSLLTPWTSFVAVDTISRTTSQHPKLALQPTSLPQGVSAQAMATPATIANNQAVVKNGSVPEPGPLALLLVTVFVIFFPRRRNV